MVRFKQPIVYRLPAQSKPNDHPKRKKVNESGSFGFWRWFSGKKYN
ncbi:hypothetical protein [Paenibacillus sonchi]|nr:hypothetical protein [Paenibacillus sonchi]